MMTIDNDDIMTALMILATYPLDDVNISGDNMETHKALALIHKVKAHARLTETHVIIPEFNLSLRKDQ